MLVMRYRVVYESEPSDTISAHRPSRQTGIHETLQCAVDGHAVKRLREQGLQISMGQRAPGLPERVEHRRAGGRDTQVRRVQQISDVILRRRRAFLLVGFGGFLTTAGRKRT